jgi:hypothetical protein
MAWTNPTRYPNSAEIANNEEFLNVNVIDNLVNHQERIVTLEEAGGGGGGMVVVGSGALNATGAATLLLDNIFSASYAMYKVFWSFQNPTGNGARTVQMVFRSAVPADQSAYATSNYIGLYSTNAPSGLELSGQYVWASGSGSVPAGKTASGELTLNCPNIATCGTSGRLFYDGASGYGESYQGVFNIDTNVAYAGLKFQTTGGGTLKNFKAVVYGLDGTAV